MPKVSTEPIFIGCELLIRQDNTILLGLRGKHIYGGDTWGLPGGHLEFGERLIEAACREVKEELGAKITPGQLRLATIVDTFKPGGQHHVHVSFELQNPTWEPRVMEADCQEWKYFPLDKLPKNLFPPHTEILENYQKQILYAK